jgi:hypothetical protein
MAYYALLDENNIVVSVISGINENEPLPEYATVETWEELYALEWGYPSVKRTSYNMQRGAHQFGKTPFRKNYAGIGDTYDPIRDAFYEPQPFPSWTLNEETCVWEPPVPYPGASLWDEETLSWKPWD